MDESVGSCLLQQGSRPDWRTSLWLCKKQISGEMTRRGQIDIDACGRHDSLRARSCAPPPPHRLPCCWSGTYPPRFNTSPACAEIHTPGIQPVDQATINCRARRRIIIRGVDSLSPPPHRTSDYSPDTYPLTANHRAIKHCSNPTNKNGVFHVKHAVRFPPTAATIKLSSSPTRGTFRSRADSAQVRPPALPAQTRPSPAHNRSRRSATRPWRSARSAALQRPYRATH